MNSNPKHTEKKADQSVSSSQIENTESTAVPLVDNRPSSIAQRKRQSGLVSVASFEHSESPVQLLSAGQVRENRARQERMIFGDDGRWYIIPPNFRRSFEAGTRLEFKPSQVNPQGDQSGYASATELEHDGWPVISPAQKEKILAKAIELTDLEERRYQGRYQAKQHETGQMVNKSRKGDDPHSDAYIGEHRRTKSVSEWQDEPSISTDHFLGLRRISQKLLEDYPPGANAFILIGNSPAPIYEFMRRMAGVVVLTLPMSNIEVSYRRLGDPAMRDRMWQFLGLYVPLARLGGKRSAVVVDITGSGNGLVGAETILNRYYNTHLHAGIRVKRQKLNPNDSVARLDTGGEDMEEFGLRGLRPNSNQMASAQKGILDQDYKVGYGYGMWNRTRMSDIYEHDHHVAGFDRERYLTMMIDLLRKKGSLHAR